MPKKSSSKPSKGKLNAVSRGAGLIAGRLKGAGSGKSRGKGGKRRKKSAMWYAREIARLKLKKRYDRIRLGVGR